MHTNKAIGQSTVNWVGNRVGDQICKFVYVKKKIKKNIKSNKPDQMKSNV